MALAPQFAATHRLGSAAAANTLEFYLDMVCPYSGKMWDSVLEHVLPHVAAADLSIVIRQMPQPWHASSVLVQEAVLAVSQLANDPKSPTTPAQFHLAFNLLIKPSQQSAYYDAETEYESPDQTRRRLAKLFQPCGVDETAFLALLKVKGPGNAGNAVTTDLKYFVKIGRQNGIHVTPTVALNGLVDNSISSSFTGAQWKAYLAQLSPRPSL